MSRVTKAQYEASVRRFNAATISSGAEFDRLTKELMDITTEYTKERVLMEIIEAFNQLQQDTPYDTGRAQAAWLITGERALIDFVPREGGKRGDYTKQTANTADFMQADTVYVINNVEYILRLNAGWSRQAPAGFIDGFLLNVNMRLQALAHELSGV